MKHITESQGSTHEIKRRRTSSRYTVAALALLFIALAAGSSGPDGAGPALQDYAWAGLSFAAVVILAWSLYVNYRNSDERQQSVQLKAAAPAFLAVMISLSLAQLLHAVNAMNMTIASQVIFIGGLLLWNLLLGVMDRRSQL